jgi:hypothetical protein
MATSKQTNPKPRSPRPPSSDAKAVSANGINAHPESRIGFDASTIDNWITASSASVVVESIGETPADYRSHCQQLFAEHLPVGPHEREIVIQIANASWIRLRYLRFETAMSQTPVPLVSPPALNKLDENIRILYGKIGLDQMTLEVLDLPAAKHNGSETIESLVAENVREAINFLHEYTEDDDPWPELGFPYDNVERTWTRSLFFKLLAAVSKKSAVPLPKLKDHLRDFLQWRIEDRKSKVEQGKREVESHRENLKKLEQRRNLLNAAQTLFPGKTSVDQLHRAERNQQDTLHRLNLRLTQIQHARAAAEARAGAGSPDARPSRSRNGVPPEVDGRPHNGGSKTTSPDRDPPEFKPTTGAKPRSPKPR